MTRDAEAPPAALANGGGVAREPRLVGRYRILGERGTGVFGTVYLAEDATTGQPVALRLFPRELTDAANVADTMRRRARAIVEASRAHPALVGVLEYGEAGDGRLFAAMERVEAPTLSATLAARQRPDVAGTLRLALELGAPLETLHNLGLVHGAVRPRNFAVQADGRVKLLDVEVIALRDAPALQSLVAAQSPAEYLAPEQIRERPVSERTDVYAFAVVIYEMLSGAPPFQGSAREAILEKHLKSAPSLLRRQRRTIPVSVEAAIMEALDKRPEPRPFMPKMLNHLAAQAGQASTRWKRTAALAGGVLVAGAVAAALAWLVVVQRPFGPAPIALPPPPVTIPAPALVDPRPATPRPAPKTAVETVPPAPAPAIPAPPRLTAPPVTAPPPAPRVAAPSTPVTPPSAATPPRVEQRERPRPVAPSPTRPAQSSEAEEPDPSAVIDWLLNRRE